MGWYDEWLLVTRTLPVYGGNAERVQEFADRAPLDYSTVNLGRVGNLQDIDHKWVYVGTAKDVAKLLDEFQGGCKEINRMIRVINACPEYASKGKRGMLNLGNAIREMRLMISNGDLQKVEERIGELERTYSSEVRDIIHEYKCVMDE